ncbi:MAG: MinD/ParA family protein [Chloroflexi bacterium]|nr:MinD/ParA family protein [Chloroflexota bacterium]
MPRVISVHSFRGGTGKSNLCANLATAVARRGHRVGIVDTDIQSPGIHVLFGLDESRVTRSLNDYLWGKCAIEETAYDVGATLTDHHGRPAVPEGSIYLIPAALKAGEIARVLREGYDVGLLNDGFRELSGRLRLDYLFIDTHPGLNEETLLSITISDVLLILLRPDQQDYLGTAVAVDVARRLDVPRMLLVVNKVLASYDHDDVRRQAEQAYGAPVAAVLGLSEDMIRLGSRDLFILRHPDHPMSQQLAKLAQRLGEEA